MKLCSLVFFICSILVVQNAVASDIGKALDRSDVSRLELLANNLNMLSLINDLQKKKGKNPSNDGELENKHTRYSVSKDHRLIIEDFYSAPVTKVTNEECNEQLNKLSEQVRGNESKLSPVLLMISPTELTPPQAQQIANEAHLIIYIRAKENTQLSLKCSK